MTTKMMIFQRGNNFPGFAVQQHTAKVCLPCGSARQSVFARQRNVKHTATIVLHGKECRGARQRCFCTAKGVAVQKSTAISSARQRAETLYRFDPPPLSHSSPSSRTPRSPSSRTHAPPPAPSRARAAAGSLPCTRRRRLPPVHAPPPAPSRLAASPLPPAVAPASPLPCLTPPPPTSRLAPAFRRHLPPRRRPCVASPVPRAATCHPPSPVPPAPSPLHPALPLPRRPPHCPCLAARISTEALQRSQSSSSTPPSPSSMNAPS